MLIKVDDKEQSNSISNAVIKCEVNGNSFNACISVTFPGSGSNSTITFEKLPLPLIGVSFTKQDGTVLQNTDLETPEKKNYSQTLELPNENITCNVFLNRLIESGEIVLIPIPKPRILPLSVDIKVENAILLRSNAFRKCTPEQTEYHESNFTKTSVSFAIEFDASAVQSAQTEQKPNSEEPPKQEEPVEPQQESNNEAKEEPKADSNEEQQSTESEPKEIKKEEKQEESNQEEQKEQQNIPNDLAQNENTEENQQQEQPETTPLEEQKQSQPAEDKKETDQVNDQTPSEQEPGVQNAEEQIQSLAPETKDDNTTQEESTPTETAELNEQLDEEEEEEGEYYEDDEEYDEEEEEEEEDKEDKPLSYSHEFLLQYRDRKECLEEPEWSVQVEGIPILKKNSLVS